MIVNIKTAKKKPTKSTWGSGEVIQVQGKRFSSIPWILSFLCSTHFSRLELGIAFCYLSGHRGRRECMMCGPFERGTRGVTAAKGLRYVISKR